MDDSDIAAPAGVTASNPTGAVGTGSSGGLPTSGLSTLIGGIVGANQTLPVEQLQNLMDTINGSGAYQQQLINSLPAQIQQQIAQYQATTGANNTSYANNITNQAQAYTQGMTGIYGPNTDAANAQKAANTQAAYASVPGTQDAIRNAMAATGGLSRGNAGVALAQPYVNAAQQSGQANMNVNATQTAQAQQATQTALQTVNSMDATMFQNTYGMTQQQAQQILTSGSAVLQNQLAQLITQNNNQTQQQLSVEGLQDQGGYNNAVVRNQQQGAIYNGMANTFMSAAAA